jgi:pyruvate dehydrogenase E1 component alpha subunit
VLIESLTYRYKGHGVSDKSYDKRFADELEEWSLNRDPITIFEKHLKAKYKGIEPELQRIHEACKAEVEEAVQFAIHSPAPGYEDLISNVYVE